ncbi:DNA-directed DNA polymerase [Tanacetum coccineum]
MAEYSKKWHNRISRTRSTKTSDGLVVIQAQLNNLGREIKKVNEKVYVAQVRCELCKGPHYSKDCPLKKKENPLKKRIILNLVYLSNKEGNIEQQLQDSKRHEENSNLIKEIRASTDAAIRNQGASIKTLEIQIGQMSKAFADLGASISVMPFSTYLNLGLGELAHTKSNVELVDRTLKHPKGIDENVLVGIGKFLFPVDFIILDMSEDVNVPLILERLFLSTAHAKIDVLRERMDLDLEARLMGETLILNKSFDPLYGYYIKLNDLNEPQELRRNRVDNLEPTIEEGEVVDEPITDIVKTRWSFISGLDDYPSECDFDGRIHINFVEDMDPYLNRGMGDVIVGEPFCKASCVEAEGLIESLPSAMGMMV